MTLTPMEVLEIMELIKCFIGLMAVGVFLCGMIALWKIYFILQEIKNIVKSPTTYFSC